MFTCNIDLKQKRKERNMNWRGTHLTEETPAPWLRSAATPFIYIMSCVRIHCKVV